jgi:hypothetical protein
MSFIKNEGGNKSTHVAGIAAHEFCTKLYSQRAAYVPLLLFDCILMILNPSPPSLPFDYPRSPPLSSICMRNIQNMQKHAEIHEVQAKKALQ